MGKLFVAVMYDDFYDAESGFDGVKIGTSEEIVEFINSNAEQFADDFGVCKTVHNYGDEIDGVYHDTVYQPIKPDTVYNDHLLCEDANTNRIRITVREISCYVK